MSRRVVTVRVRVDDLEFVLDMAKDWSDSLADAAMPVSAAWDKTAMPDPGTMRLVNAQRQAIERIKKAAAAS